MPRTAGRGSVARTDGAEEIKSGGFLILILNLIFCFVFIFVFVFCYC